MLDAKPVRERCEQAVDNHRPVLPRPRSIHNGDIEKQGIDRRIDDEPPADRHAVLGQRSEVHLEADARGLHHLPALNLQDGVGQRLRQHASLLEVYATFRMIKNYGRQGLYSTPVFRRSQRNRQVDVS